MKLRNFALLLSLAALFCMSSAFAATTYSYQTVNYPGDTFTQLLGIDNAGIVAGYHGVSINQGFTYNVASKKFTSENFPGSAQTQVIGINHEGPKTSGFYITESGKTEGFTDVAGAFTTVNYPKTPFNQLLSQNDLGQAAGYYSTKADGSGPDFAYIYDEFGGLFQLFNIPGSVSAQATGINDSVDVCGFFVDSSTNMHGWLLIGGHFTQLDDPNGVGTTQALGLNNEGQVVGSYTDSSGNSHGFVYTVSSKTWETIDDPAASARPS